MSVVGEQRVFPAAGYLLREERERGIERGSEGAREEERERRNKGGSEGWRE